jgi:NAD(P)-dependent dehydrogenase (short-subunit alcohol dehydrogenase family)
VVTGATGGLGFEIAVSLAQGCADVIVAGRNESRGREAAAAIRTLAPRSLVRYERLDLAELASVTAFARRLRSTGQPLDLLVNNAGVMALPQRRLTADGFEMQFATNYLGHFALTGLLLPLLRLSREPRVVQVGSLAHRMGRIDFDDLQGEQDYNPWTAYAQSKLASLLFARELQRRSDANEWNVLSSAAHPGYAQTDLFANGLGARNPLALLSRSLGRLLSQSAAAGARPALYAAASPSARPGEYYGPGGIFELKGPAALARLSAEAQNQAVARRLWEVSVQLTGVHWPVRESSGQANGSAT